MICSIPLLITDDEKSHRGPISHKTPLTLTVRPHKEVLILSNTKLREYPIILRIP